MTVRCQGSFNVKGLMVNVGNPDIFVPYVSHINIHLIPLAKKKRLSHTLLGLRFLIRSITYVVRIVASALTPSSLPSPYNPPLLPPPITFLSCLPPIPHLQACKPHQGGEGGQVQTQVSPHPSHTDSQASPAKRKRTPSPAKSGVDLWTNNPVQPQIPSWYLTPPRLQLLDQLRTNRTSLKPPQVQMLDQLENQFSLMQQHQQQVKQQAAGQLWPTLPNGPTLSTNSLPSPHPLSRTLPVSHTTARPPCTPQPMANGPLALSHLGQLGNQEAGTMGNNHTPGLPGAETLPGGLTGGGRSNRNVLYLQQNCLLHNCSATSDTSTPTSNNTSDTRTPTSNNTSSTNTSTSNNTSHSCNSTSDAEEAWKSQQHISPQVHIDGSVSVELLLIIYLRSSSPSLSFALYFPLNWSHTHSFLFCLTL
uniref:Uncharacterized protein n=1 Tax=Hucho hucho TaxID=62062 RepID=A0A4W5RGG2_9TELE